MKILSFGEIIWDVYPEERHIGGAPFNFAAHVKRAGAKSYLMSAVGEDALGREALKKAIEHGIYSDYIFTVKNKSTGTCEVTLDKNGIPQYAVADDTAYDHIPLPNGEIGNFDAIAFGTLALRCAQNRAVLEKLLSNNRFGQVFVDINIRPPFDPAESILFALEKATILKVSNEELPLAMDRIGETYTDIQASVRVLRKRFGNLEKILITRGEKSALLYDIKNERTHECESKKTKVVSTVGAGDCYSANFLVSYLSDEPMALCMEKAAKAAAVVVSHVEAIPDPITAYNGW